ncbi:uncharacterized protein HD556DRAFT_1473024 [Suillus plorans]|uniref:Uncharacterized protein n=1 Tax=Suillus plorans TaxID=116603 RepID=A0A9P7AS66_9AGAM|nr:uncharacterized protein HD556DRAFT_1473024 [Suillus plorans]KAG1795429.1 hypothetical protein HD556DRAFT_1473024 [Suillus plorans]
MHHLKMVIHARTLMGLMVNNKERRTVLLRDAVNIDEPLLRWVLGLRGKRGSDGKWCRELLNVGPFYGIDRTEHTAPAIDHDAVLSILPHVQRQPDYLKGIDRASFSIKQVLPRNKGSGRNTYVSRRVGIPALHIFIGRHVCSASLQVGEEKPEVPYVWIYFPRNSKLPRYQQVQGKVAQWTYPTCDIPKEDGDKALPSK